MLHEAGETELERVDYLAVELARDSLERAAAQEEELWVGTQRPAAHRRAGSPMVALVVVEGGLAVNLGLVHAEATQFVRANSPAVRRRDPQRAARRHALPRLLRRRGRPAVRGRTAQPRARADAGRSASRRTRDRAPRAAAGNDDRPLARVRRARRRHRRPPSRPAGCCSSTTTASPSRSSRSRRTTGRSPRCPPFAKMEYPDGGERRLPAQLLPRLRERGETRSCRSRTTSTSPSSPLALEPGGRRHRRSARQPDPQRGTRASRKGHGVVPERVRPARAGRRRRRGARAAPPRAVRSYAPTTRASTSAGTRASSSTWSTSRT